MSAVSAPRYTNPLLIKYLTQLSNHPLRTKALTTGTILFLAFAFAFVDIPLPIATLCFLQEVLGSKIAGAAPKVHKNASPLSRTLASAYIDAKAAKMALYGLLVSAPLSHYLVGALQKAFEGKTSSQDRIRQIIASSLLVSPIQVAGLCVIQHSLSAWR
jgi:peroxisomal membrane protein 2